jgi:hypothetical protein
VATREIPKDQWSEFCDSFSELHQGWLASVQVQGAKPGRHFEAKSLPFRGLSYDTKGGDKNQLSIFMDQTAENDLTHTVDFPTHIRLDQSERGVDQGLEVESNDGTKTIVRFEISPGLAQAPDFK